MPIVLESGSLNLLEHSGPVHACNGIALPLPLPLYKVSIIVVSSNFLYRLSKNPQISNFMKIQPVKADFFFRTQIHTYILTDRQTDIMMLIVPFSNFASESESSLRIALKRAAFLYDSHICLVIYMLCIIDHEI